MKNLPQTSISQLLAIQFEAAIKNIPPSMEQL